MPQIRVLDTETTGLAPPAQVIEVGFCDLINEGEGWRIGRQGSALYGAGLIPPEVRAIHHITAEEIAGKAPFDPNGLWLDAHADGINVVAAHNADFDGQFWGKPDLPVICTYKAALRAWPGAPSHSNGALRYWLQDQGLIAPDPLLCLPPHRAGPDAYVTAHVLMALLGVTTANEMAAWTKEPRLLPTCPIGKFRGKPWPEVEAGFLGWMLAQPTMEEDLKWNARRELDRRQQKAA